MKIALILCTHNPRPDYLQRTVAGLRAQTLAHDTWELLLIDNASLDSLDQSVDLSWHPQARIIREEKLGLTHARMRAVVETKSDLLVFSDDDTILDPDYLKIAADLFTASPSLGVAGGISQPEYEQPPPNWFSPDLAPLGCRDLGQTRQTASWKKGQQPHYPACAPIGAGMAIRREILQAWADLAMADPKRKALGRIGMALSSGEDNDINLTALSQGWEVGYFPELSLTHLIPARRLEAKYLECLAFASSRDWICVLTLHDICPWPPIPGWSLPVRKLKAWFAFKAWLGPAERIRWSGACGHCEGRVAKSSAAPIR